jgi:hypothetical protein
MRSRPKTTIWAQAAPEWLIDSYRSFLGGPLPAGGAQPAGIWLVYRASLSN